MAAEPQQGDAYEKQYPFSRMGGVICDMRSFVVHPRACGRAGRCHGAFCVGLFCAAGYAALRSGGSETVENGGSDSEFKLGLFGTYLGDAGGEFFVGRSIGGGG